MATPQAQRDYAERMAAAQNKGAAPDYSAVSVPSAYARAGYQVAPKLQGGNRVAEIISKINPWQFNSETPTGIGLKKGVTQAIGTIAEIAVNSAENVYKASMFQTKNNPINPVSFVSRFMDNKHSNDLAADARRSYQEAKDLYGSGEISKDEYDNRVKEAADKVRESQALRQNLLIQDAPKTVSDAIDLIDGTITGATLGLYTAAKVGAITGGKAAFSALAASQKEMALAKINGAAIIGAQKGLSPATKVLAARSAVTAKRLDDLILETISSNKAWAEMADNLAYRIGASETSKGYAKNVLAELAFRAPLRRENLRFTVDALESMKEQNWWADGNSMGAVPSVILMSGMVVQGGPIGFVARNISKGGKALKTAMYGEITFVDELGKRLNQRGIKGNIILGLQELRERAPQWMVDDIESSLKQFVGTNLQKGPAAKVAEDIAAYFDELLSQQGVEAGKTTMADFWENALKHNHAQDLLQDINKVMKGEGYVVAAKYDQTTASQLSKKISKALRAEYVKTSELATPAERMARRKEIAKAVILQEANRNRAWAQNQDVVNRLLSAVDNAKGVKAVILSPNVIDAGKLAKNIPRNVKKQLKDLGYIPVVTENKNVARQLGKDEAANVALRSQFVEVGDDLFEQAAQSKPYFNVVGSALTRAGLGLDDSTAVAYRFVRDNAAQNIEQATKKDGRKILNALQQWTNVGDNNRFGDLTSYNRIKRRTTTDLRMMSKSDIKQALKEAKIDASDADIVKIHKSLIAAHLSAPLQSIGLADKIIAGSYKYNPIYKTYARVQGALRYTYNPFFVVQEATETALLSQALVPGTTPYISGMGKLFRGTTAQLDDVVARMDKMGFFNDSALTGSDINKNFMATRFGEGAQDVYLGRVSAVITDGQKRQLAAAVSKIADTMGLSVEDALSRHGAMIEDIIRPIVQYPSSGALSSNLAKAMNLAMFPSRYNLKVMSIATKALAQAPPGVQLLTVNKLWEFENWLRTPEGISWQQQNNGAIQFFKWLTPLGSIQWVFDTLGAPFGEGHQAFGDMGVVGGLPFGVISQVLHSQGVIQMNTPYVSPKDGEIYARRIPESMRARVASAFMDLLGSTFTYPGATIGLTELGLPSKSQLLRDAAGAVSLSTKGSEWKTIEYTPEDLPALDRMKQDIWSQRYSVKGGAVYDQPGTIAGPPVMPAPQPIPRGEVMTARESAALKSQQKDAKASAKQKRVKTATFPSNLPQ